MFFQQLYLFQLDNRDNEFYYDYVTLWYHPETKRIIIVPDMLSAEFREQNDFKKFVELDTDFFELVGAPDQ